MYLLLNGLLKTSELDQINSLLTDSAYVSGNSTATGAALKVKNNEQLPNNDQARKAITAILQQALFSSPLFRAYTLVKSMPSSFLISRYLPGMEYGWHVDSPLMGDESGTMRVDLSITIFLNGPAEYEGGELEIETEGESKLFKLNKGDAIVYPTTKLHRVRPVTAGVRSVAVSWIQSFIKSTEQRDLLFQLQSLQEALNQQQQGSQLHLLSQQIHSNLLRMFSEA